MGTPADPGASKPVGVILAGGLGRRIGGSKATVGLRGKPLLSYPLQALRAALEEVAIIAKPDTELPALSGVSLWMEPQAPRHPLIGIAHALELAGGRAVLACAADMPFVTPRVVSQLAQSRAGRAPIAIARHGGGTQPLLGRYQPEAIGPLTDAARRGEPVMKAIAALEPALVEIDDPDALFNVNSPEDLLQAAAILDHRSAASRT
jgi:molybdopterin-guanine dinucleotide biosynthesis protein A